MCSRGCSPSPSVQTVLIAADLLGPQHELRQGKVPAVHVRPPPPALSLALPLPCHLPAPWPSAACSLPFSDRPPTFHCHSVTVHRLLTAVPRCGGFVVATVYAPACFASNCPALLFTPAAGAVMPLRGETLSPPCADLPSWLRHCLCTCLRG